MSNNSNSRINSNSQIFRPPEAPHRTLMNIMEVDIFLFLIMKEDIITVMFKKENRKNIENWAFGGFSKFEISNFFENFDIFFSNFQFYSENMIDSLAV